MMRPANFDGLLLVGLLLLFASPAHSQPIKRDDYKHSIAAIYADNVRFDGEREPSAGTGYVISDSGDILTALHVVGDPELFEAMHPQVYFPKRTGIVSWEAVGPFSAKIKAVLPEYDLALLTLDDVSYASTLPVFGFHFVAGVEGNPVLDGFAFNFLGPPSTVGQPGLVTGRLSRDTSPAPPFFEAGTLNLNIGGSGGPIFEPGDRVMAMWHGAVASFRAGNGTAVENARGVAWIIPMSAEVEEWLVVSGVTPRLIAAQRPTPVAVGENTNYVAYVSTATLRQARPDDPTSSQLFAKAPGDTEIIEATLLKDVRRFECQFMKCTMRTVTEVVKKLPVRGGAVALVDDNADPSTRVQLRVRPKPELPDVGIRYVSRDSLFGRPGGAQPGSIQASPGKTILAVNYAGAGPPFDLSRVAKIEGNAVVARTRARRLGLPPASGDAAPTEGSDQIAILEADITVPATAALAAELLRQAIGFHGPITNANGSDRMQIAENIIVNKGALIKLEAAAESRLGNRAIIR